MKRNLWTFLKYKPGSHWEASNWKLIFWEGRYIVVDSGCTVCLFCCYTVLWTSFFWPMFDSGLTRPLFCWCSCFLCSYLEKSGPDTDVPKGNEDWVFWDFLAIPDHCKLYQWHPKKFKSEQCRLQKIAQTCIQWDFECFKEWRYSLNTLTMKTFP